MALSTLWGRKKRARELTHLQQRMVALSQHAPSPPAVWPPQVPDLFPELVHGIPELTLAELTFERMASAVQHHGSVIVRGVLNADQVRDLREGADTAAAAWMGDANPDDDPEGPWYERLDYPDGSGPVAEQWRNNLLGLFGPASMPTLDSPAMVERVLARFRSTGLLPLVAQYLGEPPAVTLQKWGLRRVEPGGKTSWHQDGAFLGTHMHALNVWITLSDCGDDAPGLDMVGRRYDEIVRTGTEGAYFDWDVSQTMVDESRGEAPIVSPSFKAGDAVIFDHFMLHRTGARPEHTKPRYAIETWFFAPSTIPEGYDGILID